MLFRGRLGSLGTSQICPERYITADGCQVPAPAVHRRDRAGTTTFPHPTALPWHWATADRLLLTLVEVLKAETSTLFPTTLPYPPLFLFIPISFHLLFTLALFFFPFYLFPLSLSHTYRTLSHTHTHTHTHTHHLKCFSLTGFMIVFYRFVVWPLK